MNPGLQALHTLVELGWFKRDDVGKFTYWTPANPPAIQDMGTFVALVHQVARECEGLTIWYCCNHGNTNGHYCTYK
jgi:hypothetical protein